MVPPYDKPQLLLVPLKKGGATELVLYQKVTIGAGQQANNPWLHDSDPLKPLGIITRLFHLLYEKSV